MKATSGVQSITARPVAAGQPWLFTGRRFDFETGLYYYRARYYSAPLGRFLQTDPVGYEDQMNLYAYVGNDPVNAWDPSGKWVWGFKLKIDLFVGLGIGIEIGYYEGTNERGNIERGMVFNAEVGGGLDMAAGGVVFNSDDANTEDLNGIYAEGEVSAGGPVGVVAGVSHTAGGDRRTGLPPSRTFTEVGVEVSPLPVGGSITLGGGIAVPMGEESADPVQEENTEVKQDNAEGADFS